MTSNLRSELVDLPTSPDLAPHVNAAADFALRQHSMYAWVDDFVADVAALVARRSYLAGVLAGAEAGMTRTAAVELGSWLDEHMATASRSTITMHALAGLDLPAWLLEVLVAGVQDEDEAGLA